MGERTKTTTSSGVVISILEDYDFRFSDCWRLLLRDGKVKYGSRFPQRALLSFLSDCSVAGDSSRLAREIKGSIEDYFLGPRANGASGEKIIKSKLAAAYVLARAVYGEELQRQSNNEFLTAKRVSYLASISKLTF